MDLIFDREISINILSGSCDRWTGEIFEDNKTYCDEYDFDSVANDVMVVYELQVQGSQFLLIDVKLAGIVD